MPKSESIESVVIGRVCPEMVDSMLRDYRFALARSEHFRTQIRQAELNLTDALDDVPISVQRLDGMPHGTTTSDSTGRLAANRADGDEPEEARAIRAQIRGLQLELARTRPTVDYVDAWLTSLNDREQCVIRYHIIDGLSWREAVARYKAQFGEEYSIDTMKRLQTRALEKIYQVAA